MIIVKLMGGLGNQMFQYAFGRNLALKHNTRLILDINWYNDPNNSLYRSYALGVFNIPEKFASTRQITRYTSANSLIHFKFIRQFFPSVRVIKEPHFHFSEDTLNSPDNSYLVGYWQCAKYFSDIRYILLRDFSFKNKPDKSNQIWLELISNSTSVSMHIRRSDYVNNPTTNKFHGTCNLEYYKKACMVIEEKFKSPEYFIFSDDIEWVKANTSFTNPCHFIDHNTSRPSEDLRLMIQCKHHIIANSSFSWWGAWLAENEDKMVIAPEKWILTTLHSAKDVIPSSWIKL